MSNAANEREIHQLAKARMRCWDQRSGVMNMHIRQFLTIEEPVGRDLRKALSNIDEFDQEDLDQLANIQMRCEQLAVRAVELAAKIKQGLDERRMASQ